MKALDKMSKNELINKINELSTVIEALKDEKNLQETVNFPWVGNLGMWYWYVKTNVVVCNDLKIKALGYERKELPGEFGFEFFTNKLHPDDYDRVMENMRRHLFGLTNAYECSYRIKKRDDSWVWFYDRGKITKRDEYGKPELISGIVFDISEEKKMEELLFKQNEMLNEMSRTDFLTNLSNRRNLIEKCNYEMMRANRTNEHLSIILFDVDNFKKINDQYGHLTGDKVLTQTAGIIKDNVRITDIVGRYGGEEFMVVLPACDQEGAFEVAEKIRKAIEKAIFEKGLSVTISGGVKQYAGESIDRLFEMVDTNLYMAKQNGKNRIMMTEKAIPRY